MFLFLVLFSFCIAVSAQTKKENFIDSCLQVSNKTLKNLSLRYDSKTECLFENKHIEIIKIDSNSFELRIDTTYFYAFDTCVGKVFYRFTLWEHRIELSKSNGPQSPEDSTSFFLNKTELYTIEKKVDYFGEKILRVEGIIDTDPQAIRGVLTENSNTEPRFLKLETDRVVQQISVIFTLWKQISEIRENQFYRSHG